jgi:hypothetical protein
MKIDKEINEETEINHADAHVEPMAILEIQKILYPMHTARRLRIIKYLGDWSCDLKTSYNE